MIYYITNEYFLVNKNDENKFLVPILYSSYEFTIESYTISALYYVTRIWSLLFCY
ncbi:hypothetical protein RhiirA4_403659 [Rhizophagus irregularis]|uniref:Uncharacterized protein n=1 Tax=Rhizophagus irregularis TaxID=588596 RepID=A0A2I1GM20_9GLOM|nr:hypothetical protein RhiirA4_403659 [Rhizophagus irregularis]